jgi:DivIVA domain-containing protein
VAHAARPRGERDTIGDVVTILVYAFVLVVVGGVLFLLVSFVFGRGEELAPMPPDSVPVELPDQRPATAADVERLRLPVVLRGYRMHEVDWVLDRLAGELADRDQELHRRDVEIERLRSELDTLRPRQGGANGSEPAAGSEPATEQAEAEQAGAEQADAEQAAE